jgi:hypothetical protein
LFAFFGGGKINRVRVCPSAKKKKRKRLSWLVYSTLMVQDQSPY